jgi:hypothetical protein
MLKKDKETILIDFVCIVLLRIQYLQNYKRLLTFSVTKLILFNPNVKAV